LKTTGKTVKYLITGHRGFVGKYLTSYIISKEPDAKIAGIDISSAAQKQNGVSLEYVANLLDKPKIDSVISEFKPDFIVHLASYSSVAYSWSNPLDSFRNNTNIFLNLLESVRILHPKCKVLSVGSSEEYGIVTEKDLPLVEDAALRPVSPYAVARVAQEDMSKVYVQGFGLNVVCTRSFNHIGAGQEDRFVVSSIGKRFAEVLCGKSRQITIGDTGIIRDFLDVKDVVRAYYSLLKNNATAGQVYNICSGKGHSIQEIIEKFKAATQSTPELVVDQQLLRPVENRVVVGSFDKIYRQTGWTPEVDIDVSIKNIAQWWIEQLS